MHEATKRKHLLEPVKLKSSKTWENDSPTDDAEHPAKKQVVVRPSVNISAASQVVVSGLDYSTFTRVCLPSGLISFLSLTLR